MNQENKVLPLVLAAVHVPYLIAYLFQLPDHGTYWFGPLLWGAVFGLYLRRRAFISEPGQPWNTTACLIAVLFFLAAGLVAGPGTGLLGAVVCAGWFMSTRRDGGAITSLGYLAGVLLVTLQTPAFTVPLTWMNQRSVRLAGILLDQLQSPHLVTPSCGMHLARVQLSLADLTETLISIPCLVGICSLYLAINRRRFIQQIVVLGAAIPCAAVLLAGRVALSVYLYNEWGVDAIEGLWSLLPGFLTVALAVVTFFSLDQIVFLVTAAIPANPEDGGALIDFWNFHLATYRRGEDELPEGGPRHWRESMEGTTIVESGIGWVRNWVSGWRATRELRLLWRGLIVVLLAGATVTVIAGRATTEEIYAHYESLFETALTESDDGLLELCAARLIQSSATQGMRFRFTLATELLRSGRDAEARKQIEAITSLRSEGHSAARVWLVNRSELPETDYPLTDSERFEQLQRAVEEAPQNAEYLGLLAEACLKERRWIEAGRRLQQAADVDPVRAPRYMKFQLLRSGPIAAKNPSVEFRELVNEYRNRLADLRREDRERVSVWTADAELAYMVGEFAEAESILQKGLSVSSESDEIRMSLSALYVQEARKADDLPLGHEKSKEWILKAIETAPENDIALGMLIPHIHNRAELDPVVLNRALNWWRQKLENNSDDAKHLNTVATLLCALGRYDEAIAVLQAGAGNNVWLQTNLALIYQLAGRTDEARELSAEVVRDLKGRSDLSQSARQQLIVKTLIDGGLNQEAVDYIDSLSEAELTESLGMAKARALFREFDRRRETDDAYLTTAHSLDLLDRALKVTPASPDGISRLAKIAARRSEVAEAARQRLLRLQAQGKMTWFILQCLGAELILADRPADAIPPLEAAHALRNDPAVLNNLALAIVRADSTRSKRALKLVEEALELAPDYYQILTTRAEILIVQDEIDLAKRDLSQVLQHYPNDHNAQELLREIEDAAAEAM